MEPYANYVQFTAVYSEKDIAQSEINSAWLPYGSLRVNEKLGGYYTLPFSTNNATARSLCIEFAHLGILVRTRKKDDSDELKRELNDRIASLTSSGAPMLTDSFEAIYPSPVTGSQNVYNVYSSTQDYKPAFDLRNALHQRVDPDQLIDLWSEDLG